MAPRGEDTGERIVAAAQAVVLAGGAAALTFEAVARRLGVTKQAVIYWFPTREDLVAAVALPALRAEADVAIASLRGARNAAGAVRRFVRALAAFHLADLDRFRLTYVALQAGRGGRGAPALRTPEALGDEIHAVTGAMYSALADRLLAGKGRSSPALRQAARRTAVAVHVAVLGLCLMSALAEAVDDPLAHDPDDLARTMADLLAAKFG